MDSLERTSLNVANTSMTTHNSNVEVKFLLVGSYFDVVKAVVH